jgi:hypothetical protein
MTPYLVAIHKRPVMVCCSSLILHDTINNQRYFPSYNTSGR